MSSTIKQNVMMRVRMIRTLRPFASDSAAAFALFLVALYGIGHEVWVAKVVANMPSLFDVAAMSQFVVAAFVHTELVVQVLAALAVIAALWIARGLGISIGNALIQRPTSRVSA